MEGLNYKYIDPELINEFRLPALQFERTNKYTNFVPGTYSYKKFWDTELERVVEGYKIGDNYISGYNYNYWNYSRIKKVVPIVDKYGKLRYERREGFPNPFDYDKFYFDYLEEAETNGNHACVLKARGKGYSFKGASMLIRNYEFIPGSSSYVFVSDKNYLIKDGILNKAWYMMDFLEKTTPFAKRRIVNQDLHRKSGYTVIQDGVLTEMGYLSEIIGISIGDDPDKVRGKRGKLILFEEAGSFNHLQKSYIICRPSVEDGDYVFGLIVVFGCVCAGTKVFDKEGKVVNIEDLQKDSGIIGFSGNTYSIEPISYMKQPAKKDCYRITTTGGNVLECSHDHPILTYFKGIDSRGNDYTEGIATFYKASDLKVGDYVFVNDSVNVFGDKHVENARILGLLIGDGYYGSGVPQLSIADNVIYDYVNNCTKIVEYKRNYTRSSGFFKYVTLPEMKKHLIGHGIYGQSKLNKRLPLDIHLFDKESLSNLIGGYFDADGNVYYNKTKNITRIVLTSISKELLTQVKYQLLKFGIHCSIIKEKRNIIPQNEYKGQQPFIYRLYINSMQDIIQFSNNIKLLNKDKQDKIDNAINLWGSRAVNSGNVNNIRFIRDANNLKGGYFKDKYLDNIRKRRVISVEHIGEKDVYNLTADNTHTYLANNFITHNTGGDEKMASSQGLENLFFYPKANNILELPNVWSKHNFTSKTCAFFVPITANYSGHYDEVTGISNHESARQAVEKKYDIIVKNGKDPKTAIRYKAENCIEPEDAILKISGNRFPVTDINHRIAELMNGKELSTVKHGTLHYNSDGTLVFKHDINAPVITDFPLIDENKTGAISIFEEPVRNSNGDIPYGVYIAGNDPYDDDESTTDSLGSTFIMNKLTRRLVAEYTGRPSTAYEYYENLLRLLKYYNATVCYEQNKKGLYNYFYNNNALLYLADTPKILKDRGLITFGGSGNKLKGINANTGVNNWGRELSKMYLLSKTSQNGSTYTSTILSVPLLKELKFWNPDENFDRVSALGMLLIYEQEVLKYIPDIETQRTIQSSEFFDKNFKKRAIDERNIPYKRIV